MPDIETIKGKVLIDADRYEELIKTEERVSVLHRILVTEGYLQTGHVLRILGFTATANALEEKEKERYEKIRELDSEL